MAFGKLTVTRDGRTLLARAAKGEPFVMSHLTVGDGQYAGDYSDISQVVSPLFESPFVGIERIESRLTVTADISNGDVVTGYYMRELGIYARDSQGADVLFAYDNAGTDAEYIQSGTGSIALDSRLSFEFVISTSAQVTIEHTGGMYLLVNGDASDTTVTFGPDDGGTMQSGDKLGVLMGQAAREIDSARLRLAALEGGMAGVQAGGLFMAARERLMIEAGGWVMEDEIGRKSMKLDGIGEVRDDDEVIVSVAGAMRGEVLLMEADLAADGTLTLTALHPPDKAFEVLVRVYRAGEVSGGGTGGNTPAPGGIAEAALRLATPRRIALAGDAAGAVAFDGSRDVTIDMAIETMTDEQLKEILTWES